MTGAGLGSAKAARINGNSAKKLAGRFQPALDDLPVKRDEALWVQVRGGGDGTAGAQAEGVEHLQVFAGEHRHLAVCQQCQGVFQAAAAVLIAAMRGWPTIRRRVSSSMRTPVR